MKNRMTLWMSKPPTWQVLIVLNCLLWLCIQLAFNNGLDEYGDMAENYAWSQTVDWGTFKHPPLVAWVVHYWFELMPNTDWAYYVLAWLNVALTLWGVAVLARLAVSTPDLSDDAALLQPVESLKYIQWMAVALGSLLLPLNTLASKYNADTVLLPLWPWIAVFFVRSLTSVRLLDTLVFAVLAALGMLGKYYTGVLLLALFIATWVHPLGRRWYLSYKPYLALAIFVACLLPHWQWLVAHDFATFKYMAAAHDAGGAVEWKKNLSFVLTYYYYLPVMWLAAYVLLLRPLAQNRAVLWHVVGFFKDTLPRYSKDSHHNVWLVLLVMPMLITVVFGAMGFVRLTAHWAIPIWFVAPIWAVLNRKRAVDAARVALAWRALLCLWVVAVLIGFVQAAYPATQPSKVVYRQEMTQAIMDNANFKQAKWVGGMWQDAAAVAFYAPNHPRAVPKFPDSPEALVNPVLGWEAQDGLLVCVDLPRRFASVEAYVDCQRETEHWLAARQQPIRKKELSIRSEAWLNRKQPNQAVTVYDYEPSQK